MVLLEMYMVLGYALVFGLFFCFIGLFSKDL
jgi:hypothetical protein